MNGSMDDGQMSPQTFLYGCVLESGKEVLFNPEDDDFEHQLDLRMACVDTTTKDELHIVEVEGQDTEGQTVKAVMVSLKPSTLPSVCLGGFNITPPAVFRLKAGSGPIHISGQHLIMMGNDQFDEDSDDDEEEEEEEDVDVKSSKKRPALMTAVPKSKKIKVVNDDDGGDDEDDDEEDEEESEEEESPAKVKKTAPKAKPATPKGKGPAQNGKSPKPTTPGAKTPKNKTKSPKPQTPSTPLTFEEAKAKMMEVVKKGVGLPKLQPKFENFAKNGFRVSDPKIVADLWKWRQTVTDAK